MRDLFLYWLENRLRTVGINVWANETRMTLTDWDIRAFIAPYGNVYFYVAQDKVVWGAGNTERRIVKWLSKNVLKNCVTTVNPKVVPACIQYLARCGFTITDILIKRTGNLVFVETPGFKAVPEKMVVAIESFCSSRGYTYAVDYRQVIINAGELKYEPEES